MNQYFGAAGLIPDDNSAASAGNNFYYGAAGIIPDDLPVPVPTVVVARYLHSKISISSRVGIG